MLRTSHNKMKLTIVFLSLNCIWYIFVFTFFMLENWLFWPDLDLTFTMICRKLFHTTQWTAYFNSLAQSWPENMCLMAYLWLENSRNLLWPSFDLEVYQVQVRTLIVPSACSWKKFGQNWVHSELGSGRQRPTCEHVPNVDIFCFDLTSDVIGDPEVINEASLDNSTLAGRTSSKEVSLEGGGDSSCQI